MRKLHNMENVQPVLTVDSRNDRATSTKETERVKKMFTNAGKIEFYYNFFTVCFISHLYTL